MEGTVDPRVEGTFQGSSFRLYHREIHMGRRPWFPFYVDDFWADEAVASMTFEEVGLYLRLLSLQWREGSIPADHGKLARICGLDGPAMAGLMAQVGTCFEKAPDDPTRLFNRRLKLVAMKAHDQTRKLSEQGKAGARARWGPDGPAMAPPLAPLSPNNGPAIAKRESDKQQTTNPPCPPSGGEAGTDDLNIDDIEKTTETPGQKQAKSKGKSKSGRLKPKGNPTPPPENFKPSKGDIEWFRKNIGTDIPKRRVELETMNFLSHHARKGNEFIDWNQAWKNWMVRETKADGWAGKLKGETGRDGEFPEKAPGLIEDDENE